MISRKTSIFVWQPLPLIRQASWILGQYSTDPGTDSVYSAKSVSHLVSECEPLSGLKLQPKTCLVNLNCLKLVVKIDDN